MPDRGVQEEISAHIIPETISVAGITEVIPAVRISIGIVAERIPEETPSGGTLNKICLEDIIN